MSSFKTTPSPLVLPLMSTACEQSPKLKINESIATPPPIFPSTKHTVSKQHLLPDIETDLLSF